MRKITLFLLAGLLFGGKAKIAFLHHGNQHFADNGSYALLPGDPGYVGNSYHRTLDTHFYYEVPIDIHISCPLAQSYAWLQNDNGLLNRLRNDLVYIVGGTYAENILPYASIDMNLFALQYARSVDSTLIKPVGWDDYPDVIWIPERVWKSENLMPYSLIEILNEAYGKWGYTSDGQYVWMPPCIVLDDNVHSWYYHTFPSGDPCNNPYKVHRMYDSNGNYVFVVFISSTARNYMVWNDISDPNNPLHQLLQSLASSWDQWQIVIYGDDWEKAAGVAGWDFGQPGAPANSYDWNISWIKSQDSWIMPIHIAEAVKWWGVDPLYNDDPLDDPPIIQIDYAAYPELHGWTGGNYDNWYNHFKVTQAWGTENGPDENMNGVNGDYEDLWQFGWHKLLSVPFNPVSKVGWITLMGLLYETAWHEGDELVSWGKPIWNHTRYGGLYAVAGLWLDSLRLLGRAGIRVEDMDGDGVDEYAVYNDKLIAIFDRRGGRALLVATEDGDVIVGNLMTSWGSEGDYDDGGHTGLFEDSQAENSWFDVVCDTSSTDSVKLYLDEAYDWQGNTSTDVHKIIVLKTGREYLEARYSSYYENWVKAGVTPDMLDILQNGYALEFISGFTSTGWKYGGFMNTRTGAKGVFAFGDGTGLYYHNLGRMGSGAEKIEVGGRSGSYTIFFYAGRGEPYIDLPGPGDQEPPSIWGTSQSPQSPVPPNVDVLITTHAYDWAGIQGVYIHYGINGNWSYPDIEMVRDDGEENDFDGDGEPDPDLFGGYIPGQPFWTRVYYVIHAVDSSGLESWDNNNGQNYFYRVGLISIIIDGEVDSQAVEVLSHDSLHLYAYLEDSLLYLATESAGDTSSFDKFLFISREPGSPGPAPWAKDGYVASWDFFVGDEGENSFVSVFDSLGNIVPQGAVEVTAGSYIEVLLDLGVLYGEIPGTLYVAVGKYESQDGGSLIEQLPPSLDGDGNIEVAEYYRLEVETLVGEWQNPPVKPFELSGPLPNPFLKKSILKLNIFEGGTGRVAIYDVTGRRVLILLEGNIEKGMHQFELGERLSSGVYFIKVELNNKRRTVKFIKIGG